MSKEIRKREEITMTDYKKLVELLKGHTVRIQMHNFPDPDAVASAFGLQFFLKKHDIDSTICYDGHVDKISVIKMFECFGVEAKEYRELDIKEEDYVVLVDGQKLNSNMTDIAGEEVACIDHHPTFKECEYSYKDVRIVGACSSIIADYLKQSNTTPDKMVASALYYGIKMDTQSLSRGLTKLDIQMYEYLFDYADIELVESMYNNNMELSDLTAYGAAIQNINIYDNVAIARIPFECEDALIAMVSDFVMKLDLVTVAIIYAEKKGGLKFSVRSETEKVHAGYLVENALKGIGNGGGHQSMAGGYIDAGNRNEDIVSEDYTITERFLAALKN